MSFPAEQLVRARMAERPGLGFIQARNQLMSEALLRGRQRAKARRFPRSSHLDDRSAAR